LLLKAKLLTEQDHPPSESAIKEIEQRYSEIVAWGLRQCTKEGNHTSSESKRGRPKQSKPKNLLDDFKAYKDSFLLFLNNAQVPFDNNGSERDVRMAKVKMKVSGGFRSREGAEAFVTIRSYINTVLKNKRDALQELINAINGNAFLPDLG
jgi:transposase